MASNKRHILVVDDVVDNTFLVTAFLESEGYSVDVANTASVALERMQLQRPDLVLLDVMMPMMDGYELTRIIRQDSKLKAIPVVLITAYPQMCRIKGLAAGATDFVRKPIDFEQLHSLIQRILTAKTRKY
jgi:CheY-like chemotaxis protein